MYFSTFFVKGMAIYLKKASELQFCYDFLHLNSLTFYSYTHKNKTNCSNSANKLFKFIILLAITINLPKFCREERVFIAMPYKLSENCHFCVNCHLLFPK